MWILGKISKCIMIGLGLISGILLISKNEYSEIACMFLMINGIIAAVIMKKAVDGVEERNYIKYKLALDALNGVALEWDKKEKVLYISSKLKTILETNVTIDTFEKLFKFIEEDDRDYIKRFFTQMIKEEIVEEFTLEFIMKSSKGKIIIVECSGKGEIREDTYFLMGILLDVTERRRQEKLIRTSERKYRRALEGSQDTMFYINIDTEEVVLSGKVDNLLCKIKDGEYKIPGKQWREYIVDSDVEIYTSAYNKFIENELRYIFIEYRIKVNSEKIIWLRQRGKRIIEDDGVYIYGSISNITETKEKESKIYYMGHYDVVTDIPNRRYFTQKAKRMLIRAKETQKDLAIICMDIDNFKVINDVHGHDVGDKLLKKFSDNLKNILDQRCTIARFGGDEFIISVEDILYKGEIVRLLQQILNISSTPINIEEKEIYCTISVGVSTYKSDGESLENLIKKADLAMYKAKATGKNKYCIYDEEIAEEYKRELILKRSLKDAIDKQEIFFELQPKYWTNDGSIQGFECLSRWQHDELGNVSPVEFIKIAEVSGLIVPLGKYLIEDAFQKAVQISEIIGDNYKLAINLSQIQIRDEELFKFIQNKLNQYKVNPKCIEFEVTESDIMIFPSNNIRNLRKLKELGVSIALDDFGTGYSSLNYLKMLPIDVVKLDKSFVDDIGIVKKNEFIIEKTIELSHLLELRVVAEGVTTKEQLDYLKEKECDIIQGYYYSKPERFEKILKMLKDSARA